MAPTEKNSKSVDALNLPSPIFLKLLSRKRIEQLQSIESQFFKSKIKAFKLRFLAPLKLLQI